ncbi:uncharacterized protein A1O9_08755 [Exophiala aquamarina CBS 119918]|uniref:DUF1275 domain protein n=1 Tax=Exophiala aquamarina CBS 119918 TaxID=1182545 RepID=A0A072P5V3_9EURO|nr:uncharacterized protein A1O9_08755 [Exophiala aquamarina CBS 119918]KEF55102.1 hypothetical protein A1O9_08755 [Exophiala aquamarina CBS 119918]
MFANFQGTTKDEPRSKKTRLQNYLLSSLRVDILIEAQLLLLTFSTGIQDAISFPDFHCFASNQTGNSVVLAVGLAGLGSDLFNVSNVGVSLGCFIGGAITTGQISHFAGQRRRAWLLFSHLLQTIMIFGAAWIQSNSAARGSGPSALGAIALLAFSSGAQVASMRPMRIPEITTAMATAAWVDLVVDSNLLVLKNRSRDRRALFLLALVAGSFAGAFMHVGIGSSNALIVSACGKLLVFLTIFFNREQKPPAETDV